MSWWSRNAASVEAIAATVPACVAVAALVGVKLQLDTAEQQQQARSARDAYRAIVDRLLYSAEHARSR